MRHQWKNRQSMSQFSLTVLTFNVWLLPLPVPKMDRRRRLARIVSSLRDIDADIVAIQEAFDPQSRRTIVQQLRDRYDVNDNALDARWVLGVLPIDRTGGLLTLSKFPILHSEFVAHPLPAESKFPERVGEKGVLHTIIETPFGKVEVLNVHLYAGGKAGDRAVRTMQLHHFSRTLGSETEEKPVIVAGDFNAWHEEGRPVEERSQPEYRFLRKIGLVDVVDGDRSMTKITYDVDKNPLAAFWSNKEQGGQDFDSIFYRPSAKHEIDVKRASIVLNDPAQPLSDHYGVLADLIVRMK